MHELTEDERKKVAAQVEAFVELITRRYDVKPEEVLEAVKWVRERKAFSERVKSTGLVSLIGLLITAISLAVWEGVKAMVGRSN
jgi:hypothetical protein